MSGDKGNATPCPSPWTGEAGERRRTGRGWRPCHRAERPPHPGPLPRGERETHCAATAFPVPRRERETRCDATAFPLPGRERLASEGEPGEGGDLVIARKDPLTPALSREGRGRLIAPRQLSLFLDERGRPVAMPQLFLSLDGRGWRAKASRVRVATLSSRGKTPSPRPSPARGEGDSLRRDSFPCSSTREGDPLRCHSFSSPSTGEGGERRRAG